VTLLFGGGDDPVADDDAAYHRDMWTEEREHMLMVRREQLDERGLTAPGLVRGPGAVSPREESP
jgi:hypothetical protein